MLIALNPPRPVFITGGPQDQWADPRGQFLAEVAAGPVYRLPGKKDLGTSEQPPLDTPLIAGDLVFHYHTGGRTITAADWKACPTSRFLAPMHAGRAWRRSLGLRCVHLRFEAAGKPSDLPFGRLAEARPRDSTAAVFLWRRLAELPCERGVADSPNGGHY